MPSLAALAGLVLLAPALRAEPAPESPRRSLWVDVAVPERVEGPLPWLELRGRAGSEGVRGHDLVIAIDVSGSTAVASGIDVDGDGVVGRRLPSADDPLRSPHPRRLCSDSDDTILRAEIAATRRLLERLALRSGTRVGLMAFAGRARTLAPVGAAPDALEAALSRLEAEARPGGGTHLARAFDAAVAMLAIPAEDAPGSGGAAHENASAGEASAAPPSPRRTLLLLSDGNPEEPAPASRAAEATAAAGARLAEAGVELRAFALGVDALAESDVVARVARSTRGRVHRLASAGEVVDALPEVQLAALGSVEVRNATLDAPGRAVRLFADGSFDAILPLAPGVNEVRVTARGRDAGPRTVARRVLFEPRPAAEPGARRAAERWLERLEARTVETERALQARPPEEGPPQTRQLEVGRAGERREDTATPGAP